MKKFINKTTICIAASFFMMISCNKDALNEKPDKSLVIPKTAADYQGLFESNSAVVYDYPYLPEVGADDYYLDFANWNSLFDEERNAHIWMGVGTTKNILDWTRCYQRIFRANLALSGLEKLPNEQGTKYYNMAKGTALFLRAFNFWHLAQEFAKPYNSATAATDLGIPLRLSDDVLESGPRASIKATYERIIADLTEALPLLESLNPSAPNKSKPNKEAVNALLARVSLSMGEYDKSLIYCNAAITDKTRLIDFNTLSTTSDAPFSYTPTNTEVMFDATMGGNSQILGFSNRFFVNRVLYDSYASNDLRKVLYFKVTNDVVKSKGNYSGNAADDRFMGIALDEVYLMRAECQARAGNISAAMSDLNLLSIKRYQTSSFISFTAIDKTQALNIILSERRKELVYRGLRWTDLRRLNLEGYGIVVKRVINGIEYTLEPNSPKYVYPIPLNELQYNPIEQNLR